MHTIRLRGPWELEPVERFVPRSDGTYSSQTHELPPSCRCQMPSDWAVVLGSEFLGVVRYTRKFNRPTNLDPHEQVWLVVDAPRSCGVVNLNGQELGSMSYGEAAKRFDVTRLLNDFNQLTIDVRHPELDERERPMNGGNADVPGGLVGEVRLEIVGD